MLKKKYFLFCLGLLTIYFGYFINENSSGGAIHDYKFLIPFIRSFSNGLSEGFSFFLSDTGSLVHSPIFYILSGLTLRIVSEVQYLQLIYILISSLLPFVFYKILKLKFDSIYVFIFSLIIFSSPYFRTSSIWLLGDNLSLIFFSLSVYFFNKTNSSKELKNYHLTLLFLILCCYIRYYYAFFYIFYFCNFYKKINNIELIKLLLNSFILSLPAFVYFFYIFKNYNFFMFINLDQGHSLQNYLGNFLIILQIILFYLIPFIFVFYKKLFKYFLRNKIRYFVIITLFFAIHFIDIFFFNNLIDLDRYTRMGGGVISKIINLLQFNYQFLMIIPSIVSFIILDFLFRQNRKFNYFLIIILTLCLPFSNIYQKYLDPLIYIILFGLINSNYLKFIIVNLKKFLVYIYGYFVFFLISTFIIY